MYRQIKGLNYTRREYSGGVPANRITQFDLGAVEESIFTEALTLCIREKVQIRHTALEAARIACNKYIQKMTGSKGYHLKVRVFPHHIIRENKTATGAGADRISQGMRRAFGKPVGTAVRTQHNQKIFTIYFNKQNFKFAHLALWKAGQKLPSPFYIIPEQARFDPAAVERAKYRIDKVEPVAEVAPEETTEEGAEGEEKKDEEKKGSDKKGDDKKGGDKKGSDKKADAKADDKKGSDKKADAKADDKKGSDKKADAKAGDKGKGKK